MPVCTLSHALQALISKQGEANNFATTKERDDWIRKSLKAWEAEKQSQEKQIKDLQAEAASLEAAIPEAQKVDFHCCFCELVY